MNKVAVRDTTENLLADVGALFDSFGGVPGLVGKKAVLLKPNGVHFMPGQATASEFIEAVIRHLRLQGVRDIFLMENCTAGNLTRVVFAALGWDRLCERYGVVPVYLDEGPTRQLTLPDEDVPVRFPAFLYERLIEDRENNFYLSLPRLKTHSMSHVTLGIKNQQGLLIHEDRMKDHNHLLGRRLARILGAVAPDFTMVEGITATIYGHFPILRDLDKSIIDTKVLLAGDDVVAVDTVGARVFGYDAKEVDHIRIAGERGLGCSDLSAIEIEGSLDRFTERYPYLPDIDVPADIRLIHGKEMACYQGCRGNTEIAMHMFAHDYGGKGGFNIVMGKGVERKDLEGLDGDFLVVGPCAAGQACELIKEMYPGRKMLVVPEHNDLANMSGKLARLMRVNPLQDSPLPLYRAVWLLLKAKLNRTSARLINPF